MAKANRLFVGIDLGGTNIQGGIVTPAGQVIARDSVKTKSEQGADAVIGRIVKLVETLADHAKAPMKDIGGVGIGAPGTVDPAKGVVRVAVNLRWTNFPLAATLRARLKKPVVVDNDVNVGAWGEHRAGAGKGFDDMLAVFVGTGIGGGIVLGGKLYRGHYYTAGEIGHTIIRADAGRGRRTLENLASRTAIVNLLTQLIASNHESVLTELTEGDSTRIRSKVLAQAMRRKDPLTREVVSEAARLTGIAIANAVTLLSLPAVVVGGGVTEALKKPFVDMVRASFEQHVFPPDLRKCKILQSSLGDDAGVIGAALLAAQAASGDGK